MEESEEEGEEMPLAQKGHTSKPSGPLLNLVDSVFQLQQYGWLRRQVRVWGLGLWIVVVQSDGPVIRIDRIASWNSEKCCCSMWWTTCSSCSSMDRMGGLEVAMPN